MANLIAAQTGNFTDSATWGVCETASHQDSDQNIFDVTTSARDSSSFVLTATEVDAIALRIYTRNASPSGTFTVTLRNTTTSTDAASVTVDVADIPLSGVYRWPWALFKFTASHTPNGTDSYVVRVVSSSGSQLQLVRSNASAFNCDRKIRTTTAAAPGASDHLVIASELTGAGTENDIVVTMNNTATTTFGPNIGTFSFNQNITITCRGTLYWSRAGGESLYFRYRGMMLVCGEGVLDMGQVGDPLASNSTSVLEWDMPSNIDSGLVIDNGFWYHEGPTKAVTALLTADCTSSATSFTCTSTAGWEAGDILEIAGTDRTGGSPHTNQVTLNTVPTSTTFTTTGTIGNARTHVAVFEPEIINRTQRSKIRGISTSLRGWIRIEGNTSTVRVRYAEIYNFGSNQSDRYGIVFNQRNSSSAHFEYCSLWELANGGLCFFFGDPSANGVNTEIRYNGFIGNSGQNSLFLHTTPTMPSSVEVEYNYVFGSNDYAFYLRKFDIVCRYNRVGNHNTNVQAAFGFLFQNTDVNLPASFADNFQGNVVHNTNAAGASLQPQSGLSFNATQPHITGFYLKGWKFFHTCSGTAAGAMFLEGLALVKPILEDCIFYGNDASRGAVWIKRTPYTNLIDGRMINCKFGSNYRATQYAAIQISGSLGDFTLENCDFGVSATGGITTHGTAIVVYDTGATARLIGSNCRPVGTLASGLTNGNASDISFIRFNRFGQTSGDHRSYFRYGNITSDAAIFNVAAPSERLTPNSASFKLESSPRQKVVDNGDTCTITVQVRKSASGDGAAYTGAQPRLIVRRNYEAGITVDTVLDTAAASTGTWEALTGTTAAVTDDTVLEFFVDCDGTAGWINVDDWS